MKNIETRRLLVLAAALAAVCLVIAQAPAIKRTPLQKADLQGTDREVILGKAEIAPGGEPGVVLATYVVEKGKPLATPAR